MPKMKLQPETLTENVLLAVMVPEELDREIKAICKANGINKSQGVRWMLSKILRKPTMIELTLKTK